MSSVMTFTRGRTAVRTATRLRPTERLARIALAGTPAGVATAWLAHRASDRPMTMDESFTVLTATRSWGSFARGVSLDPGMAVYYAVLRAWSAVAGDSLGALRLFSTVAVVAAVLGVAAITVSRGRSFLGMLASVATVLSPMVREAAVDARAAALGAAAAVWLVVAFDRWTATPRLTTRAIRLLAALSLVVAFVHPSTLFLGVAGLGLLWRRTGRQARRGDRRTVLGAAAVLVLGVLAAAAQSGAAEAVAAGHGGITTVLAQLPGGRALAGLAVLLTATVLLAGLAYDHERVLRWFGGAALCWFAACFAALPVRDLFVPRYFVAAAVVLFLVVVTAKLEAWTIGLIATIVAIGVLGSAARLDTRYGYGSTWCDLTTELSTTARPGDHVVFAHTVALSPVTACLGDGAAPFFATVEEFPSTSGGLLDDPRAMWQGDATPVARLAGIATGQRLLAVWTPGQDAAADTVIADLPTRGVRCETERHGALALAVCTAP